MKNFYACLLGQTRTIIVTAVAIVLLPACKKESSYNYDFVPDASRTSPAVAIEWMNTLRDVVKLEGKNPPQASRIYAYSAIGLYEAVIPGNPKCVSLSGQITGLSGLPILGDIYHVDYSVAANEALYQIANRVFGALKPESSALIEGIHKKYYDAGESSADEYSFRQSLDFGQKVALAVMNRADNDNFATTRTMTYMVPAGQPQYWVPTGAVTNPLEPYWGTLKCFAMSDGAACSIHSNISFSSVPGSAFYNQANEVASTVTNLTQAQKDIALWWADGGGTPTPPGHWVGIEGIVANQLQLGLAKTTEMYAKVNIAMADAFISCWNEKYRFNLVRPQSYIRAYIPGQSAWTPFIATPPFPEYPSGHSVASGAAGDILRSMFGEVRFTDNTNTNMGYAARTFNSFSDAANEAAISRLYGGIHYREAIENGVQQGKEVCKAVVTKIQFEK